MNGNVVIVGFYVVIIDLCKRPHLSLAIPSTTPFKITHGKLQKINKKYFRLWQT